MGDKGRGSQFMSHNYPGQNEPRNFKHGKHDKSPINLNTDSLEKIARLPMVSEDLAREIAERRPFRNWDELAMLPGVTKEIIDNLKSGKAVIE